MEREYRVMVLDKGVDIHNAEMQSPGWSSNLTMILERVKFMREVHTDGEIVYMEVSPWYFIGNKWSCYGCEYAACPSNSGMERIV